MRLLSLDLIAYGNFTGCNLAFPPGKSLYVVYGRNEAGKSTCVRAIRGLLYGIPETTTDDFFHESKRLRVGGILARSDGERLSVVRRKGRKDTLAGPDGKPVAEDSLKSFLGGVDRETFVRVFWMSRDELVSGGRTIVEGKGALGESLFGAGLGGADLKGLLEVLESEAQALFKPSGTVPLLNAQARVYKEVKTTLRDLSLLPKAWAELDSEVSALDRRASQLKEQLAELSAEKDRLERLSDALPVLGELEPSRKERAVLGEVKVLREGFSRERRQAQSEIAAALSAEKVAKERIEEIDAELRSLSIPKELLAQEKTVQALVEELGGILKARKDLPRIEGQVLEARSAATAMIAELRPDLTLESAAVLRLTVQQIGRIRGLVEEYGSLTLRQQSAAERASEYAAKLAEAKEELAGLVEARDVSQIEHSVAILRKRGDLEKAYSETRCEAESAREDTEASLKGLPLWSGTLESLESLPLPPEKTIDEFEKAFDAVDDDLKRAQGDLAGAKGKIAEIDSNLGTMKIAGEPPTEADLTAARGLREQGWALVRSAWLTGERDEAAEMAIDPSLPLEEAYEKRVVDADMVADRMRREAEAVAHKANLLAERKRQEDRIEELWRGIEQLQGQRETLEGEWTSRWASAGLVPLSPREMQSWMAYWKELKRRAAEIRIQDGHVRMLAEELEKTRGVLLNRLSALGEAAPPVNASLEEILLRVEGIVRSEKDLHIRRGSLEKGIQEAIKGLEKAEAEEGKVNAALTRWERDWREVISGVTESLPVSAATAFLDGCSALSKKLDDIEKDKVRIEGMKKDVKEFDDQVERFVARFAPDLAHTPADQSVRELSSRVSKAKADAASRAKLSEERIFRERDLDTAQETLQQMLTRLAALRREAACEIDEELPEAEARSDAARSLDAKIYQLSRQVLALAAGRNLEQFTQEAEREGPERIRQKLVKVAENLSEAQETFGRVRQDLGAATERLRMMDGRVDAAQAAQEAQETLAVLRENTERYLRIRLAEKILRSEIERYRERSQGPVLKRAGELFASVTEGRFVSLEPDYGSGGDQILVGIRENGEKVSLAGMSDGTQDQLYLALRLASLETFVTESEPLPLLVDDALVNFDNDRARAALRVLANLGINTQVLFFTHHQHMVDLAREAVDEQALHIQPFVEVA